jgi:A/G-specific adenine glycosylase
VPTTAGSAPAPGRAIAADRRRLFAWYEPRRDAYPWRSSQPDPYRVLVSEVMLQQTQAPRVVPIFEAFVARFPDVRALADAARPDVIVAWAGLGYHRRAVALYRTAIAIVERHGGEVPRTADELRSLPGIGPYTASAVASIAFGAPIAAVDTNVRRIAARYLLGCEPDDVPAREVGLAADGWVPSVGAGDWNQALMDLGRDVCRPRPRCEACPLLACRFRAAGRTGRPSSRRQPAFEGSLRQVRGRVLATLRSGGSLEGTTITGTTLAAALDEPAERIAAAVAGLVADGLAAVAPDGRIDLAS